MNSCQRPNCSIRTGVFSCVLRLDPRPVMSQSCESKGDSAPQIFNVDKHLTSTSQLQDGTFPRQLVPSLLHSQCTQHQKKQLKDTKPWSRGLTTTFCNFTSPLPPSPSSCACPLWGDPARPVAARPPWGSCGAVPAAAWAARPPPCAAGPSS